VAKIDYKLAYRQGILHFKTALQTSTQLPDDNLTIITLRLITLRLTFGGAPCPFEWGIMSETICNLANELLKCDDWDPRTLHAPAQADIPKRDCLKTSQSPASQWWHKTS
jgi:hypothetical protein